MYLIFVVVVWVIIAGKFLDWRRWKEFYPTVQYFIICNLLYNFLYYNHSLWEYRAKTTALLNHTLIDVTFTFIIVPLAICLYLQHYPPGRRQVFYVLLWSVSFWAIEYVFFRKEMFLYKNGWSIWWTFGFNLIMFAMLRLHYRSPLLALGLSVPITAGLMLFFPLPFDALK